MRHTPRHALAHTHTPPSPQQGERDDKIIAVHCHDPAFRNFRDISELPSHRLAEIRSFFEVCGLWRVPRARWQTRARVHVRMCACAHVCMPHVARRRARLCVCTCRSEHSRACGSTPAPHPAPTLPPFLPTNTTRTSQDYKKNENKAVRVDEILGAEKAKEIIEEAIQMYVDSYVPKKYRVTK
jgi:hypothetical protein